MAIHQQGNALVCVAGFLNSGAAATGLTVAVDVWEIGLASGTATQIVSSGSATEIARGAYYYRLASSGVDLNAIYLFMFFTAGTADQKVIIQGWSVGMTWVENLNAQLSGIAAAVWAVGTRTLTSFGTLVADVTTAVWANGTRTLSSFGTLVADIWANGTRTLTGFGTLVADVAAQVWNSVAATFNTAGTMGQKLNAAGGATDPLTNAVPGSYGEGTAGEALGDIRSIKSKTDLITTNGVTITSPYNPVTGRLALTRGDDYPATDPFPLQFSSDTWPDLTGATVQLTIRRKPVNPTISDAALLTMTDTVALRIDGDGIEQTVTFEPMSSGSANGQVGSTVDLDTGVSSVKFDVQATLASGTKKTLVAGLGDITEDQTRG